MEIAAIRPAASPSATSLGRPEVDPNRGAVRTELPKQKSVASADAADKSRSKPDDALMKKLASLEQMTDQVRQQIQRELNFDKGAGEWVYRTIDKSTDETVFQFPNDSLLNMRAYRREMEKKAEDAQRQAEEAEHLEKHA